MASLRIKIHEQCSVAPSSSTTQTSLPLTFFDLRWLRMHPGEVIFFYSLPIPQSHPSFFFEKVLPNLKTSLSHTLQHFLPLAGNVVWPSHSPIPIIQYNPGDVVSLVIAESHADFDFNRFIDSNSPHEAALSRSLLTHLDSSDSHASVLSLQITLFPNKGYSIGFSIHHGVLDGKSLVLFIKAWASLCQQVISDETQTPSLVKELTPFFDRKVIKDPTHLGYNFVENLTGYLSKWFPNENNDPRCLRILPFPIRLTDAVRATFVLSRGDLEKIKKTVLPKWDEVEKEREEESESKSKSKSRSRVSSKPTALSSFVLTCAYVAVCIAKAINGVEREKQKFGFGFMVDCRTRLEPQIPDNYCGNCAWLHIVDAEPLDFIKEEGVVIVAKSIHREINKLHDEGGIFHSSSEQMALAKTGVQIIGVSLSNRFGVYGTDFGWGKPSKVEIAMVDKSLSFGLAESKHGDGGVEVGLVLNNHEMDLFVALFHRMIFGREQILSSL